MVGSLKKRRLGRQKNAGLMGSRVVLDSGQKEGLDSLEMAAVVATTSGPSLKMSARRRKLT